MVLTLIKILNPYLTYISDSARKASDSLVEQYLSTKIQKCCEKKMRTVRIQS
jgi:hypothetical protein